MTYLIGNKYAVQSLLLMYCNSVLVALISVSIRYMVSCRRSQLVAGVCLYKHPSFRVCKLGASLYNEPTDMQVNRVHQVLVGSGSTALYRETLKRKTPSRAICHCPLCDEREEQPIRGNGIVQPSPFHANQVRRVKREACVTLRWRTTFAQVSRRKLVY